MIKLITSIIILYSINSYAQQDSIKALIKTIESTNPLSFSGYVEAYYGYDFNKPSDNNRPGFIFGHNRHNEFNVNLAFLKGSYASDKVRANLALGVGTYMNTNYSSEPGVLKNVYEADAGYKLSAKSNLWFDIGILPSHIGWESALSKDCWTLTRSIGAENTPFYQGGAKLSYMNANGKWLLVFYALNGWQRITRVPGNSLMSWGSQIQYKPSDQVLLNYSTFFGTDKPDSLRTWRYFHDLYGVFQFSRLVGLTLGFDYGQEQVVKGSSMKNNWYTPVAILRFTPSALWAFALRGEYYCDEHGIIIVTNTANGFKTSGFSANVDYLPAKNISIRLEGKLFHSKDNIFIKNKNATNKNSAITFSTAISFQ